MNIITNLSVTVFFPLYSIYLCTPMRVFVCLQRQVWNLCRGALGAEQISDQYFVLSFLHSWLVFRQIKQYVCLHCTQLTYLHPFSCIIKLLHFGQARKSGQPHTLLEALATLSHLSSNETTWHDLFVQVPSGQGYRHSSQSNVVEHCEHCSSEEVLPLGPTAGFREEEHAGHCRAETALLDKCIKNLNICIHY